MQVFGLDGGQEHGAGNVAREFLKLFANFGNGFLMEAFGAFGGGDKIERFGLNFIASAIESAEQGFENEADYVGQPDEAEDNRRDYEQEEVLRTPLSQVRQQQHEEQKAKRGQPLVNEDAPVVAARIAAESQAGENGQRQNPGDRICQIVPHNGGWSLTYIKLQFGLRVQFVVANLHLLQTPMAIDLFEAAPVQGEFLDDVPAGIVGRGDE